MKGPSKRKGRQSARGIPYKMGHFRSGKSHGPFLKRERGGRRRCDSHGGSRLGCLSGEGKGPTVILTERGPRKKKRGRAHRVRKKGGALASTLKGSRK